MPDFISLSPLRFQKCQYAVNTRTSWSQSLLVHVHDVHVHYVYFHHVRHVHVHHVHIHVHHVHVHLSISITAMSDMFMSIDFRNP